MEQEMIRRLAPKMGITSSIIIRKAEEYRRLMQVKCTGFSAHTTATSNAVMCLDLAAMTAKYAVDKDYLIKLSGLNKQTYQSCLKSLECLLGLDSHLGIRELAVQYGCMQAVNTAAKILQRYEASLPEAHQSDLDLSKPLFTTSALFAACKCMKMKADKGKLVAASGVKRSIFDRLCTQMEKFGQQICSESPVSQAKGNKASKRRTTLLECVEEHQEEDLVPLPKQQKTEPETAYKENYEEWKQKILENAAKAKNTGA
ncbi:origin recognition complex subunit 6 [Latimeria chalumnae]|uniref:Origin recognition complex subunit 6 n=1 Tax=Latimeria chalumnae TaxID=7897 RepID=H3A8F7_LATCH|nr:PREDICTED: origin recognition complex subunit 6 [Latimeria chalumnae]|eukprot:XP_006012150.1 PREDICTED: origin recognition complex subunit 6 [Latimeria chalumnae]